MGSEAPCSGGGLSGICPTNPKSVIEFKGLQLNWVIFWLNEILKLDIMADIMSFMARHDTHMITL